METTGREAAIWSLLKNSKLVTTRIASKENIYEFTEDINRVLPVTEYSRGQWSIMGSIWKSCNRALFRKSVLERMPYIAFMLAGSEVLDGLGSTGVITLEINKDKNTFIVKPTKLPELIPEVTSTLSYAGICSNPRPTTRPERPPTDAGEQHVRSDRTHHNEQTHTRHKQQKRHQNKKSAPPRSPRGHISGGRSEDIREGRSQPARDNARQSTMQIIQRPADTPPTQSRPSQGRQQRNRRHAESSAGAMPAPLTAGEAASIVRDAFGAPPESDTAVDATPTTTMSDIPVDRPESWDE
jgi:hypothetical protein